LSRITGGSAGAGGGGGGASFSGSTGIGRLFNYLNGGQIAWLLPTSLIALVAAAILTRRAPRIDRTRAALIIWGGWLLVTGVVLSFASGIIHTYYTVELAPAVAALVAVGTVLMWRRRTEIAARWALACGALVTGIWSYILLRRASGWHPWVADMVLAAGVLAAVAVAFSGSGRGPGGRRAGIAAVICGVVALGGGSAAYALSTAATPHTGAVPSAGPSVASSGFGGPGGGQGGGHGGRFRPGGFGAPPVGGFGGGTGGAGGGGGPGTGGTGGTGGAVGGSATSANSALTAALEATSTKWAAAAIGSQTAGPLELASGKAVMSIGGFNGSDPAPTLAQFEQYVAAGQIHYFIAGGGAGAGGAGAGGAQSASSQITAWVSAHFTATTMGNSTVYDLTKAAS
jgi:4-amino-4-deoxy-L-arabinose transferase-like glycosyltransferase